MTEIRPALLTDRARVLATLRDAFFEDPIACWVFEDETTRGQNLDAWHDAILGLVPDGGVVDVTGGVGSVAVWHPPVTDPDAGDDGEPHGRSLPCDAIPESSGARASRWSDSHWKTSVRSSPMLRFGAQPVSAIARRLSVT